MLSQFIEARNHVFHGLSDRLHHEDLSYLPRLNRELLVVLRNYIGLKMGLTTISGEQLGAAMNPPLVSMTVHYELPPPGPADPPTQ